jgi:methylated-DNA-protein-cysteine methyltransferase-like protein
MSNFTEGIDYYYNNEGLVVLTSTYQLKRGQCCGKGCMHCPYEYCGVEEPRRTYLLRERPPVILLEGLRKQKTISMIKVKKDDLKLPAAKSKKDSFSFFDDVYAVVRQIPKGRVSTYGAVANYLGTKLSARMVGWAMNAAHAQKPKVPAHRVVNRNGMLTGRHHFSTPTLMEELLLKEKIKVEEEQIIDFENHFWDPSEELGL